MGKSSVGTGDRGRPGRLGRAERERLFWERVATGRPPGGASATKSTNEASAPAARGESLEAAVLTLLTVMLFGLGWVAVEIERPWDGTRAADGYAWAAMHATHTPPDHAHPDEHPDEEPWRLASGTRAHPPEPADPAERAPAAAGATGRTNGSEADR